MELVSVGDCSCLTGYRVVLPQFFHQKGWALQEEFTGTLIAVQSTGIFGTEGGAAYIAEGAHTFEMTGMYGDAIYCLYDAD